MPAAGDAREIAFGNRAAHGGLAGGELAEGAFPSNVVTTSRYTVFNFVPKNLWEQLHKAANAYFLLISFIMFLGNHTRLFEGTINFFSTFMTLAIMMTFSAIISALDDRQRHIADAQTNNQEARVARIGPGGEVRLERIAWHEVRVGDVLVIRGEEEFPADLVPLACSGDEGGCYVSTANLDGETNLKIKTAAPCAQRALCAGYGTSALGEQGAAASREAGEPEGLPLLDHAVARLAHVGGKVTAEAPKKSIHNFNGRMTCSAVGGDGGEGDEAPLSAGQLLLRGTQLRNTAWCLGLVVYSGRETRMAMNSRKAPSKVANVERTINATLVVVIGAQALLALVGDISHNVTMDRFRRYWYLFPRSEPEDIILNPWIASWLTFFVLFSNLMPISLYATMEVCNYTQAYFIQSDLGMYDEEADCPASARSTNLGHELGQVSYIFSDKTGTLTQNVMKLKQVAIAGQVYGSLGGRCGFDGGLDMRDAKEHSAAKARAIDAFMEVLAVSHTVVASEDQNGRLRYEAESPDEGALVEAARELGCTFKGRRGHVATVELGAPLHRDREEGEYEVLALNAFTSSRKRMSVVVRRRGEIVLLVKGADNIMLERSANVDPGIEDTLEEFAKAGLRTLVLATRVLSPNEFAAWQAEYESAQTALTGRDEALAAAADKLEAGLSVVGVTAIEDKLQEGVQDAIVKIRCAGVKLWVLTGDKLETARNIGFSTRVLNGEMDIETLDAKAGDGEAVLHKVKDLKERIGKAVDSGRDVAMLVTGQALEEINENGGDGDFLAVAMRCCVVIACRVSPSQKAQMVRLVRTGGPRPAPVTLAIGDGANDVPMIQEAQVGVGISGKEGRQAVNSADFAIGQFRFLERLLLVHGRWNYRRVCKFTLYSFWKNAVLVLLLFYYGFASGNAGTSLFENWVRASYNVVLSTPIIATGMFDRDISAQHALEHPQLYETGRKGMDLNARKLLETLLSAVVHSMVMLTIMILALPHFEAAGAGDFYTFGTAVYSWLILAMNIRVAFLTTTWNWGVALGQGLSFLLYAVFLVVYCFVDWNVKVFSPWMYWVPVRMMGTPVFWVCLVVVPALAIVIDAFKAYLLLEFWPDKRDFVLECARDGTLEEDQDPCRATGGSVASAPLADGSHSPNVDAPVPSERMQRSSSYAFDHPEGDARHVLSLCAPPTAGDTSLLDFLPRSRSGISIGMSRGASRTPTEVESAPAEVARPNRPNDSAFAQQTMESWQFVLTWRKTVVATAVVGCCLLIMGLIMAKVTDASHEFSVHYAGEIPWQSPSNLHRYRHHHDCSVLEDLSTNSCIISIELPETFPLAPPIHLYYVVDPFFQNYPAYLDSFIFPELAGQEVGSAVRESICKAGTRLTASGAQIFPCGLQATSLFNDTFEILHPETLEPLPLDQSGVAWATDMSRFGNPAGYPSLPGLSWLFERYPSVVPEAEGAKNALFASWMRPSPMPRVMKPYGVLPSAADSSRNLTVRINSSFPVASIGASKQLVIATHTAFGGASNELWNFLIAAGLACLLATLAVLAIQRCCAREPGVPRQCVWTPAVPAAGAEAEWASRVGARQ